ncbi:ATP-binding protein [Flavihumibacter stibioxidans]|uniref:tetratricopeptide repeat-containing sensor histidine kinase n=1 Tax=Flavihumibacter stibioxidans TaxID=1834163 RepID=UPI00164FA509|nr:ATP-binding protein [Flavihumibacter stibioxidans]
MKKLGIHICFLLCFFSGFGQDEIIQSTRQEVDSILQLVEAEKDPAKRFELILDIYDTRVEGYPLLILETFQKLLLIAQKSKDIIAESNAYSLAGQGYRLSGDHIKGLDYHHKAIVLAEKSRNISVLSWAQNQIGHIYKDRGENEKALNLYTAAKQNASAGKVKILEVWPMMNLAAVFLATNQLDSSLFYGKLAYEKTVALRGFATQSSYIFSNIAGAYSKMGDNPKALEYYNKAINSADENHSVRYRAMAYQAFAEHFQRSRQTDSCILYAKKAIDVVHNSVFSYLAIKPSKLLTDIYENSNADSTIKYLKIYKAANDSLNNTRANQQLQMMTFEEDQRQRDIAAEKINYQNKIRTNLLLAAIGVFLIIGLILYQNNRQKQKANKILEATLDNLKSTQSQLVQSEKMASLGELTAGIAHEIQNPLNFVNNFSEVSAELVKEMVEEMDKGNKDEVKAIANDLVQNLEKINHHGKRADGIVKGMLQHSRSGSGIKEPTNINALADEYLRLAYHGLRAKDKSFNAAMKTDFDDSIGNINILPQDMGRVILNLITNAFYAVNEKKKTLTATTSAVYEPAVTVSTKRKEGKVMISVTDNGNGIPKKVIEKIFQPFFTTKPTGQGTGLGLSMSYDIVTKGHGGELKVETKENEGATFIISLPA